MSNGKIYQQIVDFLKEAIDSGRLKIGDAIYSENMLCEKFNVSCTSVRKAIRQMVDENLLVSRQGLGTFVKSTGHGVIHNSVCMINHFNRVLRYDICDTYYMDLIYGVEEEVNRRGLNFQMFSTALAGEEDVRAKMGHIKVDGAVVDGKYLACAIDPVFFAKLTPHVVVLDANPAESTFPAVACDAQPAFAALLELAAARGGLALYLYNDYDSRTRWCLEAFRKAVRQLKFKNVAYANYVENVTYDNFLNLDHYHLIGRSLDRHLVPGHQLRTVIADSDHGAIKAINYLKRLGYAIPGDIAVSGFSGMNLATMVEPALTTVRIDPRRMAAAGIDLLLDTVNGVTHDHARLVPVELVRRQSL